MMIGKTPVISRRQDDYDSKTTRKKRLRIAVTDVGTRDDSNVLDILFLVAVVSIFLSDSTKENCFQAYNS